MKGRSNRLLRVFNLVVILVIGAGVSGKEPRAIGFGKTFGGQILEAAHSIEQTANGGYIAVVAIQSDADPQKARRYFWVLKLDDTGGLSGARIFQPINYYRYMELLPLDDQYIIAGKLAYIMGFRDKNEFFITRTDDRNQKAWEEEYGELSADHDFALKQTRDKGFIAVGETSYIGQGMADLCLLRLDKAGKKIWQKDFGTSFEDRADSVDQTGDGGFIVGGNTSHPQGWVLKVDKKGAREWDKFFDQEVVSVLEAVDGGYLLLSAARPAINPRRAQELVLSRLGDGGKVDWEKRLPQFHVGDYYPVMIRTRELGYLIAGETDLAGDGNTDLFVLKLDRKGNREWDKTFGGSKPDGANAVSQTRDGGFIIAGYSDSLVNKERDLYDRVLWVLKLDDAGNCAVQNCRQK